MLCYATLDIERIHAAITKRPLNTIS